MDKAFQSFFARVKRGEKPGVPRFKGRHRHVCSFDMPTPHLKRVHKRDVLTVKGIGKGRVKAKSLGDVRQARLVVTPGRLKVQRLVDTPEPAPTDDRPPLGCEVGIKAPITLSNGCQAPKRERDLRRVKRCPRRLARAVKGSNRRRKTRRLLAKAWQRVQEREQGALPALTPGLVNHPSARFCVEA